MGNRIYGQLMRDSSKFFKTSYSPEYKTFLPSHVLNNLFHPLHVTQARRARHRKREGLWWHVTAGSETSNSSFVRTWARRRLREAVVQELKARGYDENGKVIKKSKIQEDDRLLHRQTASQLQDITGSLRLHVEVPILQAKFVDVKLAAGHIVRILAEGTRQPATATIYPTITRSLFDPPALTPATQPPIRKLVSNSRVSGIRPVIRPQA